MVTQTLRASRFDQFQFDEPEEQQVDDMADRVVDRVMEKLGDRESAPVAPVPERPLRLSRQARD